MPLQNRVDPWGELVAASARGLLMGNRGGRIHDSEQNLGRRRWASRRWIACEMTFKGRRRTVWGDSYTELFFLDEVTALAAGHRPCFECRRAEAKAFVAGRPLDAFDRQLHAERTGEKPVVPLAGLPDGAMVDVDGKAYAIRSGKLLRWSFAGYVDAVPVPSGTQAKLLTPPTITAILAGGYQPRWHQSAQQWDD
jgi:hypothetical protein